ncbi:hypothetical protein [Salinivibrio sp. KP-1]|uniref:hypothetical protein n=1 Tax=Salinivibrio sp. KP-1 TaxID=1406902 RepID=UPI000614590F|nr:hypothetical protein [Salinivibrio sp. KP-1]KKA45284.1 hypothetical protein WN56_04800 [Salinivibrio sp. KP-1]
MEQSAKCLAEHMVKSNKAMEVLFRNQHHESALILLFSWVDRLAWLSIENEHSTGQDFKRWLNTYLFVEGQTLPCNANDLWASRCALLHTGTAEARDVKSGKARYVFYYGGQIDVTARNSNEQVYVNVGDLHVGLIEASRQFLIHLENKTDELAIANKKLAKILNRTTDF